MVGMMLYMLSTPIDQWTVKVSFLENLVFLGYPEMQQILHQQCGNLPRQILAIGSMMEMVHLRLV